MPEDGTGRPGAIVDFAALAPRRTMRRIPAIRAFPYRPFDLNDFMVQLEKIREMGPFEHVLGLVPGLCQEMKNRYIRVDEPQLRRVDAIIASMTPWERQHPDRLDSSRQRRVVRGSGTSMGQVRSVLSEFNWMRRMMNGPRGSGPSVA